MRSREGAECPRASHLVRPCLAAGPVELRDHLFDLSRQRLLGVRVQLRTRLGRAGRIVPTSNGSTVCPLKNDAHPASTGVAGEWALPLALELEAEGAATMMGFFSGTAGSGATTGNDLAKLLVRTRETGRPATDGRTLAERWSPGWPPSCWASWSPACRESCR